MDFLVTIGIPFYNSEKFLAIAINSVLNQSYSNFELILSDDGSTDCSLAIAQSFNDPRIKILTDGENKGISYRLNQQISMAVGKYFARMDADDILFPDRIKKQVEFLTNNSVIDVVGSYAIMIDDNHKILGLRKSRIPNTIYGCFRSNAFIHPTTMGKTEWFKKYKYVDELKGVEDVDLWIRSYHKSNFFVMEEALMFYRDPLKIKFKTYKFRTLQRQKLYKINRYLLSNSESVYLYWLKLIDFLKVTIYFIGLKLWIDNYLVMNRNIQIHKKSYIHYTLILCSTLNTKALKLK